MVCWAKRLAVPLVFLAFLGTQDAIALRREELTNGVAVKPKEDSLEKQSPFAGNRALVRAMEKVASQDNPENRKKLYEVLLGSMLFVHVPEIPGGWPIFAGAIMTEDAPPLLVLQRWAAMRPIARGFDFSGP